jgi:hypothetical protein
MYSDDGSVAAWIGLIGTLILALAAGATSERLGVALAFAPVLIAIPLGTTNEDSGAPDAMYVLTLATPVLLVLVLLGMATRRLATRARNRRSESLMGER